VRGKRLGASVVGLVALFFVAMPSAEARAKVGAVTYVDSDCRFIVVSNLFGFVLAEKYSFPSISKGDPVLGEQDQFGFQNWQIGRSRKRLRVYVQDYWLNADTVVQTLVEDGCDVSSLHK
jgi:hypothetical protein